MGNERIIFIGGRDRGLECIRGLVEADENLAHIFCMEEDAHESERYSSEIIEYAEVANIPITVTKSVKSPEKVKEIKKLDPDLIIVMGWRTIIPQEVLEIPKFGSIAAHESLLPKYRGFAPINWAIINGENESGVTLFYLNEGTDSGDIIAQRKIPIGINDTAFDIYQKTKSASIQLLFENLKGLKEGVAPRIRQDSSQATYTCARVPEDGVISWEEASATIHNLVRALSYPYPGAFTTYEGKKLIIQKSSIIEDPNKYVGRIFGRVVSVGEGFADVLTGDGVIRINEIEVEQGKIIKANGYLRSIKGTLGR